MEQRCIQFCLTAQNWTWCSQSRVPTFPFGETAKSYIFSRVLAPPLKVSPGWEVVLPSLIPTLVLDRDWLLRAPLSLLA